MKNKLEGFKKKITFPLYFILSAIIGLVGFVEAGFSGLLLAFAGAILCAFSSLLGLIPFVGIPIYFYVASWFNSLLLSLGIGIPVALTLALYIFFLFALIANLFISFLVLLLLLKIAGH